MKKRTLLLIPIGLLITGGLMYRNNAIEAQKQVSAIIIADKAGKPVDTNIKKLQAYSKTHMNASTSFALQGSYSRAVVAAQAAALQQTQAGAAVYANAQASCSARVDSIQLSNCVTAFIAANSTPGTTTAPVAQVDKTPYIYKPTSPSWTFDTSGVVLLSAFVSAIIYTLLAVI